MSRDNYNQHPGNGYTPERRFSIAEAIDILGFCERTLFQYRKEGILPFYQKSKKSPVYFTLNDFEVFWGNLKRLGLPNNPTQPVNLPAMQVAV